MNPGGGRIHRTHAHHVLVGTAALVKVVLEAEGEVHGLARRGPVEAPVARQAGDQHQASSGLRVGWRFHRHGHGARRVVHVDAELAADAGDDERDGLACLVPDGVGHQFAGEQDRDGRVDRDVPGVDGRPDLAAGFGRRGRSRGERDAARRLTVGRRGAIVSI